MRICPWRPNACQQVLLSSLGREKKGDLKKPGVLMHAWFFCLERLKRFFLSDFIGHFQSRSCFETEPAGSSSARTAWVALINRSSRVPGVAKAKTGVSRDERPKISVLLLDTLRATSQKRPCPKMPYKEHSKRTEKRAWLTLNVEFFKRVWLKKKSQAPKSLAVQ